MGKNTDKLRNRYCKNGSDATKVVHSKHFDAFWRKDNRDGMSLSPFFFS